LDRALGRKPVVIAVGTRSAESETRRQKIEKYALSEFFSVHTTRQNTQLFMPIRRLTDDDIWEYLSEVEPPWGGDYYDLINLYREAYGGECPVISDASALNQPSCGEKSPRFGCWTCTLVKTDSSLQGLIDTGYDELKPLYEFRNWLIETRDEVENRLPFNRRGQVRYRKGDLIWGPYRIPYRKEMLSRLLNAQERVDGTLISHDELRIISEIWAADETFFSLYRGVKVPLESSNTEQYVEC
jgi:DNA sulfur modification protein DndC